MAKISTKLFGLTSNTILQLHVHGKQLTLIGTANISQNLQTLFWMLVNQWVSMLVSINGNISLDHLIAALISLTSQYGTHTTTTNRASMIGKIIQ